MAKDIAADYPSDPKEGQVKVKIEPGSLPPSGKGGAGGGGGGREPGRTAYGRELAGRVPCYCPTRARGTDVLYWATPCAVLICGLVLRRRMRC
eukprot:3569153-Rhodomonas_salina.1